MNSQLLQNWLGDKKTSASLIGAAALYGVSRWAGSNGNIVLPQMLGGATIPTWALGAALGLGTSLVVDTVSDTVLAHIPGNQRYQHTESIVLHLLTGAAAFSLIPKVLYTISGEGDKINNNRLMMFAGAGLATEGIAQILSSYYGASSGSNSGSMYKE